MIHLDILNLCMLDFGVESWMVSHLIAIICVFVHFLITVLDLWIIISSWSFDWVWHQIWFFYCWLYFHLSLSFVFLDTHFQTHNFIVLLMNSIFEHFVLTLEFLWIGEHGFCKLVFCKFHTLIWRMGWP